MGVDIRWPLGALFVALGALLTGAGILGDPAQHAKSLGVNVNLLWGIALVGFGAVMLLLARRATPR